jgi:hypothetical protein
VNRLNWLVGTYCQAYSALWVWLTSYTSDDAASKIARRALANLFRWACNAVQTTQGPYADVAELALSGLLIEGFEGADDPHTWPLATLLPMDDAFHYGFSHLYAAVYSVQYEAGWTVREREEIFVWLMSTVPTCVDDDRLEAEIKDGDLVPGPLRRAVELIASHTCDGKLICTVMEQMWRDEHASSRTWMLAQKSREAIAPWLR